MTNESNGASLSHESTTSRTSEHAIPSLDVLALDDDPDFREYVVSILQAAGHTARTASTPQECYAAIEAHMPDLLLLDMNMGVHTGAEVLAEVRRRWSKLCVVVVTGYPSMESMRETFKQDVFDYVAKPFSVEELNRVLQQAALTHGLGGSSFDRLRSELGRQIRLTRAEKRWTLKELSEASGVSVSQLSSIERGAHLPSMDSFLAVAHALGSRPSEWLRDAGF